MLCKLPASITALALLIVAFATSSGTSNAQEEVLKPGDQINLSISETPPSDKTTIFGFLTVSKAGTLRLPRLKAELKVAGVVRPSELTGMIEKAYRDNHVFKNPKVGPYISSGIDPKSIRHIRVAGEVKVPGKVPYRPDLTLIAALSARGGFTDFAALESVRVIRVTGVTVHNLKGRITPPQRRDIKLNPGDCIFVSRLKTPSKE